MHGTTPLLNESLAARIPITKYETEKAAALVQLGFPAVEPVMPQILEWLQDRNWPVAHVFQPFLAQIGEPLAPYIRAVLEGQDDSWKYDLLQAVVSQSLELAHALGPELERIASKPTLGESKEEVHQTAVEILEAMSGRAASSV